jgi:hypothetical protein
MKFISYTRALFTTQNAVIFSRLIEIALLMRFDQQMNEFKTSNELMNVVDYETMIVNDKLNNKIVRLKFANKA